jgi:hypothetical protein
MFLDSVHSLEGDRSRQVDPKIGRGSAYLDGCRQRIQ